MGFWAALKSVQVTFPDQVQRLGAITARDSSLPHLLLIACATRGPLRWLALPLAPRCRPRHCCCALAHHVHTHMRRMHHCPGLPLATVTYTAVGVLCQASHAARACRAWRAQPLHRRRVRLNCPTASCSPVQDRVLVAVLGWPMAWPARLLLRGASDAHRRIALWPSRAALRRPLPHGY